MKETWLLSVSRHIGMIQNSDKFVLLFYWIKFYNILHLIMSFNYIMCYNITYHLCYYVMLLYYIMSFILYYMSFNYFLRIV